MKDKRKLPFPCIVLKEAEEITNKFSGEKVMLPPDAVAVYDTIKGAERLEDYEIMNAGLEWFLTNEPKAYMVLLDWWDYIKYPLSVNC